ncbi:MAG: hypothetical protein L6Q51_03485 [Cyclobacteriaceae bacterium]|nr:hypothetical protein [Cyclobacteriaceae bacterium]
MKYCAFLLLLVVASFAEAQTDNSSSKPPDTVQIGSYIISIHDINFQQKEYTIRFWLWLIYDNLQFDFANQIDIPNAKTIEEPEVLMDMVDGKMWQLMKMKCVMKQNWKVGDFPFDKQRLVVHIENSIYDQNQLVFVADEFGSTFDRELTLDGWRIRDFKVNTNTHEYITVFGDPRSDMMHSEYASFNILIDIERDAWGLFLKIFIGMYIAFLIAALSFTPKATELEPRYGLPVGGLFAAVGNKYIIDSLLPESSSFTLVDTLHTITFLGIFVTLLISAVALRLYEKDKKEASARVDYWGSRIVIILYVVLNIVFVWLAEK